MKNEVQAALLGYMATLKANRVAAGLMAPDTVLGYTEGGRYVRIYKWDDAARTVRSVLAFVDATTGELYRADSWKKCGRSHNVSILSL